MLITKADGTTEEFKENKLRRSLKNAGAHRSEVEDIIRLINKELYELMPTQAIYARA